VPPSERIQFVADRGDARRRLDHAILRHLHDVSPLSRTRIQSWLDSGRVLVDGQTAGRASQRPREGATVTIALPDDVRRREPPAPEPLALTVLFEDEALLVVDKPAGLVVHPTYKQTSGTLLNRILAHRRLGSAEPGIVTRLDRQTSGIVLVAVGLDVHRIVQQDADEGRVKKEYLAVVEGVPRPSQGLIADPLGRDAGDRRRMVTGSHGVPAATRYDVLAATESRSLVRCELVTGRTHQIRAHMASRGWQLVGDATYGTADPTLGDRQALHAWRIQMPHPFTRQPLIVVAPPPDDLLRAAHDLFTVVDDLQASVAGGPQGPALQTGGPHAPALQTTFLS
jgi:23S rRNA pseudouridine1911/1915/1917 synthase